MKSSQSERGNSIFLLLPRDITVESNHPFTNRIDASGYFQYFSKKRFSGANISKIWVPCSKGLKCEARVTLILNLYGSTRIVSQFRRNSVGL
jgi:hypothetical protein